MSEEKNPPAPSSPKLDARRPVEVTPRTRRGGGKPIKDRRHDANGVPLTPLHTPVSPWSSPRAEEHAITFGDQQTSALARARVDALFVQFSSNGRPLPYHQTDVSDRCTYDRDRGLACAKLYAQGDRTLLQLISQEPVMPSVHNLYLWLAEHEEFHEWWEIAKKARAAVLHDLVLPALLASVDTEGQGGGARVSLARLRIEYLMREIEKCDPSYSKAKNEEGKQPPAVVLVVPERARNVEEWSERFGHSPEEPSK